MKSYAVKKFIIAALAFLFVMQGNIIFGIIDDQVLVLSDEIRGRTEAEWTILTYIQADNDLAPFAEGNVRAMEKGMLSDSRVNKLVQWDQPENNKTWRYRITTKGRVQDASLSKEMGYNPAKELVASMAWAIKKYPAKRYALILWNHGSGIQDFRNMMLGHSQRMIRSWIQIPGMPSLLQDMRGVLYDDSQGTCLTNPDLLTAVRGIKKILGRNIDILGMDACLMSMVEVGYQVKDNVELLVGSQQTEPADGWGYQKFVSDVTKNPSMYSIDLAKSIVDAYKGMYKNDPDAADYTQSVIKINAINDLKENIDQFIAAVAACKVENEKAIRTAILAARKVSIEMAMPEYIDLYSFYSALLSQLKKTSPKSAKIFAQQGRPFNAASYSKRYLDAVTELRAVIASGMLQIEQVVPNYVAGMALANVKGICIYYPSNGRIHPSYSNCLFGLQSNWPKFVMEYKK